MNQIIKKLQICELIKDLSGLEIDKKFENIEITGVAIDSRTVESGFLFAALKGANLDGRQFIEAAIKQGAVAILVDDRGGFEFDYEKYDEICFIKSANAREFFSKICAKFVGKQPDVTAAITGTNGKTSVANFCLQIWDMLGKKTASIGTVGLETNLSDFKTEDYKVLTTPDPVALHHLLGDLKDSGIENLAMEASSHGISQHRLDGVYVKVAAFTSFSRDHLDYHHSMEEYLDAKLELFGRVMPNGGVAVINADMAEYQKIKYVCREHHQTVMGYGMFRVGHKNYIDIYDIVPTSSGQQFSFEIAGKVYNKNTHLIGDFQIYNMMCAAAIVIACGANVDDVTDCLERLKCVNGRMEKVDLNTNDKNVYIDYAHTPYALEKALMQLRKHTKGKLFVVFGCGGDRDKGKRSIMGKVASDLADYVFVTDDNPRSEDAAKIREEILEHCPKGLNVGDRKVAIKKALEKIGKDDILLIAGKGHEKTQTIGAETFEFCDKEVAIEQFNELNND